MKLYPVEQFLDFDDAMQDYPEDQRSRDTMIETMVNTTGTKVLEFESSKVRNVETLKALGLMTTTENCSLICNKIVEHLTTFRPRRPAAKQPFIRLIDYRSESNTLTMIVQYQGGCFENITSYDSGLVQTCELNTINFTSYNEAYGKSHNIKLALEWPNPRDDSKRFKSHNSYRSADLTESSEKITRRHPETHFVNSIEVLFGFEITNLYAGQPSWPYFNDHR